MDKDRPVIWVYSGTPRYLPVRTPVDSSVVIHASIAALANEAVQVILTTGHHSLPRNVYPLPANFRHVPYVPGQIMANRSDLMIHHGGYGSCQTGLYVGTPAVIIPTYSERESNARRVKAVGAGEFIVPETDASGRKSTLPPLNCGKPSARSSRLLRTLKARGASVIDCRKWVASYGPQG